jgi:ATP-binding cassette subfamily F protein 3
MLAGQEPLSAGEYVLGHNAQPDYFAQDQYKVLDPERRMLDDLEEVAPRSTTTELRNLLGCFLFSDDEVFKTLGVLSGGERNRYALARMLLHPSNFLLLDEPTNHLDLRAKDVLLNALQEFNGTVVFVSHDRYFIDKLATRIFEVGNGRVEVFPGNYEDYVWRKEGGLQHQPVSQPEVLASPATSQNGTRQSETTTLSGAGARVPSSDSKPAEPRQRKLNPIKLRQMKERAHELEEEITRLETGIAACEQSLQHFVSADETARLTRLLETHRADLEALMTEWEEVSAAIESH